MVERARELHRDVPGCEFVALGEGGLGSLDADSFDLVYTILVLQHLPGKQAILDTVSDLFRLLRPGGLLAFQVPTDIRLRSRLQPGRRVYRALRAVGVPADFLYNRLHMQPMRLSFVEARTVNELLDSLGARRLSVTEGRSLTPGVESSTFFATK
jgi:SAM-dependent methyltransferase